MTIKPAGGVAFPVTVPVLVIGAGACGLTAALAVHDAGVETLVLERDRVPHGSTALSSGFTPAAGTRFQRTKGIEDSPALLTADLMIKSKGRSSSRVRARVAETVGPTLEWLADRHQVPFRLAADVLAGERANIEDMERFGAATARARCDRQHGARCARRHDDRQYPDRGVGAPLPRAVAPRVSIPTGL